MPTIFFLHLGKFQPAKVGKFQPAETGEYSTGVDKNVSTMLEGSKNRGEGFFITHLEARRLIADDTRNADVVIPILSGGEITDVPDQAPQRCAIFFWNWDISRASEYRLPFSLLQQRVLR